MDRRRILLIAAVLVAALGATLVFVWAQGADNRAEQKFETVDVLEALQVINPGETIEDAQTNGKLTVAKVPSDQVLDGAQADASALAGQVALISIYPGEQIITSKFGATAAAQSSLQIPDGQQAISVNLTDPARVAGFVNPGSEVAIYYSQSQGATPGGGPFTRMLLSRVTVLGVGSTTPVSTTTTDETGASTTEELPRTLLTIAVDQEQAEKVIYSSQNGELSFALLTDKSIVKPADFRVFENLW